MRKLIGVIMIVGACIAPVIFYLLYRTLIDVETNVSTAAFAFSTIITTLCLLIAGSRKLTDDDL